MYTTYILINTQWKTYVGSSWNFEARFQEHNNPLGKCRWWTRCRWPWKILWKEEFITKIESLKREKILKSGVWREQVQKYIDELPG